ncbi:MAG: hypothetical protein KKI09_14470 [Spirochaetes bacterium]|nr:hypothetical protein [Spirochaetota bacterium]MBU0956628.1 hypothetical protein [Spirochaetota bacterium]
MAKRVIDAPAKACIEDIQAIQSSLLQAFKESKSGDTLVFNIDAVRKTDSSFAQLIIAAAAEAEARSVVWTVQDSNNANPLSELLLCASSCELCSSKDVRQRAKSEQQEKRV